MWESVERFDSRIERENIEGKSVKKQIVVRESIEEIVLRKGKF